MPNPNQDAVPGLRKRTRADGTVVWYWIASAVSSKADGFGLKTVRLTGDEHAIRQRAMALNAELREWLAGRLVSPSFNGTIGSLIDTYTHDEDSPYRGVKANTRRQYDESLKIIRLKVGNVLVAGTNRKDLARWHRAFRYPAGEDGPDRLRRAAHAMKLLRILFNYGKSMRWTVCKEAAEVMEEMRFALPPPRRVSLGAEHAQAVVKAAIKAGRPSIALAQALQFELTLRQRDVIGEWTYEPAASGLKRGGWRWANGVLWSDVVDGVLTKQTTKTAAVGQWPLEAYPLIKEALAEFPDWRTRVGPMIVSETDGLPYRSDRYRIVWRDVADAAGVPRGIWNMDSRAGGITEADEAGADLRDMQRHATHANPSSTGRYVRQTADATARVAELRVKHREKGKPE